MEQNSEHRTVTPMPIMEPIHLPHCRHEWRVVENFFQEISRTERAYARYCTKCLETGTAQILLLIKNKKHE